MVENLTEAGGFLLGRRTYEIFAAYWPNAPQEQQALAQPLNTRPKYMVSTTLSEPLAWQNSVVLQGDVAEAVAGLKQENSADLHVIGSTKLVQTLMAHDLVDEFRLMIDLVVVGGGKRIFGDDGVLRPLHLVDAQVTTTGAILATYAPEHRNEGEYGERGSWTPSALHSATRGHRGGFRQSLWPSDPTRKRDGERLGSNTLQVSRGGLNRALMVAENRHQRPSVSIPQASQRYRTPPEFMWW